MKTDKLIYISHIRYPSNTTHAGFAMRTCQSFARQGQQVELWMAKRHNPEFADQDPFTFHGVEKNFTIKYIPTIDWMRFLGDFGFSLMLLSFSTALALYGFWRSLREKFVFYGHDTRDLLFLLLVSRRVMIEIHDFYRIKFGNRWALNKALGLVVTNQGKINSIEKEYGVSKEKMLHRPNSVDMEKFKVSQSVAETREKLNLPQDKKLVVYIGHLAYWKGVYTLADAARHLADDTLIYMIGGEEADRAALKEHIEKDPDTASKIVFVPHQPYEMMPLYLHAADVLVLPNTAKDEASRVETSPVKLFDYMAAGKPIVASDLPSIRNIVDERAVLFFVADDERSLADALSRVIGGDHEVSERVAFATKEVAQYSWAARAKAIVEFIAKL